MHEGNEENLVRFHPHCGPGLCAPRDGRAAADLHAASEAFPAAAATQCAGGSGGDKAISFN